MGDGTVGGLRRWATMRILTLARGTLDERGGRDQVGVCTHALVLHRID
jgi:hypothetical protein